MSNVPYFYIDAVDRLAVGEPLPDQAHMDIVRSSTYIVVAGKGPFPVEFVDFQIQEAGEGNNYLTTVRRGPIELLSLIINESAVLIHELPEQAKACIPMSQAPPYLGHVTEWILDAEKYGWFRPTR